MPNLNDDNNNNVRQEKDEMKVHDREPRMPMNEDDMLNEGDIFYSMTPEEFIPYFAQEMVSILSLYIALNSRTIL